MASEYVKVGLLTCQQKVFVRTLRSVVISCTAIESSNSMSASKNSPSSSSSSPASPPSLYHVICNDSVLFPKGGGQDCDYGWLFKSEAALQRSMEDSSSTHKASTHPVSLPQEGEEEALYVTEVQRMGDRCVMTTPAPLKVGEVVWQKVDWPRRFANMQHHTGQHLLTAVIEDIMGLPTCSVAFSFPYSYVQVDVTPYVCRNEKGENSPEERKIPLLPPGAVTKDRTISLDVLRMLEERCNECIRNTASVVDISMYSNKDELYHAMQSATSKFRSRSIPEDVTGPFRTITLRNVDQCTCCGTHVEHLSQLQVLHVLPQQEVKNNSVKIFFTVGERAIQYFNEMFARERQLTVQLGGCRAENFISELQQRSKATLQGEKKIKQMTIEIAELRAAALLADCKKEAGETEVKVLFHLHDDADFEYFQAFRAALNKQGAASCILIGGWTADSGNGNASTKNNKSSGGNDAEEQVGQVVVMVGSEFNLVQKKKVGKKQDGAKENKSTEELSKEAEDLEKKKKRFDLVCQVLQRELGDVKGGVSSQGFRGKGSLKRWKEMICAVRAAVEE